MATVRLRAFAEGVTAGLSGAEAARRAGYSDNYANTHIGHLMRQARDEGLLPTDEDQRDVIDALREVCTSEAMVALWTAQLNKAKEGDVSAARLLVEYLAGKPTQKVTGNIDAVTEVVFRYIDDHDFDGE